MSFCASHNYIHSPGHEEMSRGHYEKAAEIFSQKAESHGVNELLYLLDQSSALLALKKYEEAIQVLLRAEKLAELKDYTSVSEEAGVLLNSSNVRTYTGEDFEKVLINVYLALSYAALGNEEDALVEARKINLLLHKMITDGKRNYQESPFARYLSAMLWESGGEFDNAYVDYKKTYDLDSSFPEIDRDLLGMARKNSFEDRFEVWRKKFPQSKPRALAKDQGELVVIFEAGRSPKKIPRDGDSSNLPRYSRRDSSRLGARLKMGEFLSPKFVSVLDIEKLSTDYLEDRIGRIMAAKIAGVAAKGAVGYGVAKATKNSELGQVVFIALLAADSADLRSWLSLPRELQMLRTPLTEGVYDFQLEVLSIGDTVLETQEFKGVAIKKGKKTFVLAR